MKKSRLPLEQLKKIRYLVWTGDLQYHYSFEVWKQVWTKIFRQLETNENLNSDEFLWQNKVTALVFDDEIFAMHLLSTYHSPDFNTHPYFKGYGPEFINELNNRNIRSLQSMQYFWVDDKWSVSNTLVNFGAILGAMSIRHQIEQKLDASITIARTDVPSASLGKKFGFEEISKSEKHNVPVAMLACFNPVEYPRPDVNEWAKYYWENKSTIFIDKQKRTA